MTTDRLNQMVSNFCFHCKEPGIHDSKSVAKLFQIDSDINSRIPYPLVLAECLQEHQCLVESHDCDASQGQQKRRQRKIEQDHVHVQGFQYGL